MHRRLNFFKPAILTLCASIILTGCKGDDDDTSSSSSSSSSGSMQACTTDLAPSSPLRRLTRFEYKNSVRDLLNIDTSIVQDIPADSSDGFDNNAALQLAPDLLVEKYVTVSEALATEAVKNLSALTGCSSSLDGTSCAKQFAKSFGRRAFRRSITTSDESMFMAAYNAGSAGGTHAKGIELMVRMALQSPHFLYRLETSAPAISNQDLIPLNSFEVATRLSYFLWGSGPDDALLDVAAQGKLASKQQVAAKAREMLASPKARQSLSNFLEQWSGVKKLNTITKNTNLFPNYSDDVQEAMKLELPALVDDMFASNDVSLSHLLTTKDSFISAPLWKVYGVNKPAGSKNTPVKYSLPEQQGRSGLLTQAGFLSVQGHPDQTSPVLRGKFVRTNLLCDPPTPPPDNVDISVPELSEAPTARERADLHLSAGGNCRGCHTLMDPIGLAFENFDGLGQYRETEAGHSIDASGEILYIDDPALQGEFVGVRPLAKKLASSTHVQNCVADHMFRFAAGRFENQQDACSIGTLHTSFTASDGDLVELMVAMTQTDAFLFRTQEAK